MNRSHVRLLVALTLVCLAGGLGWWWTSRASVEASSPAGDGPEASAPWTAGGRKHLDEAPCSVRGRVVRGTDGAGVVGATVMIVTPAIIGLPPTEPRVTQTKAAGEFQFDDVEPGRFRISATAEGLLPGRLDPLSFEPGKEYTDIEIALDEGGQQVFGSVTDRTGGPVAGARIEVSRTLDQQTFDHDLFATTTNERGQWSLRLRDDHYTLQVVHPDYVRDATRLVMAGIERRVDRELVPGGVVRGRVLTRDGGQPVPHAEVRLVPPGQIVTERLASLQQTRTESDAEGRFELRGLPAGVVAVSARTEGFGVIEPTQLALGVAEEIEGIEVLADPGYTIAGYVVREDDETVGVPGVVVLANNFTNLSDSGGSRASAHDGYFELHGLLPGEYSLMTMGGDVLPSYMRTSVEVTDSDEKNVLLKVASGVRVRGRVEPPQRVLLEATIGIDPAKIGLLGMGRFFDAMMSTMKVERGNPDGTFTFGPLAEGKYTLELVSASGMRAAKELEITDQDLEDLRIELDEGATLRGRVLEPDGTAVPGVVVALHEIKDVPAFALARYVGGGGHEALTNHDGSFEITGLAEGDYQYSVRNDMALRLPWAAPDDPAHPLRPRTIIVDGDATLELHIATGRDVTGVVRDDRGRPQEGVWVTAWPHLDASSWAEAIDSGVAVAQTQATRQQQAHLDDEATEMLYRQVARAFANKPVLTDRQGRFSFPAMRFPSYTLAAEGHRVAHRTERTGVRPGDTVELELVPVASIAGSFESGNDPQGAVRVTLEGPDWRQVQVRADAPGFTLDRLLPGKYRLSAEAPGGVLVRDVELEAGETKKMDLPLADWSRIRGRVVGLTDGKPMPNLVFQVVRDQASVSEAMAGANEMVAVMMGRTHARTDEDGRFTIEELAPGRVTVHFYELPGFVGRAIVRAELDPEQDLHLERVQAIDAPHVSSEERGRFGFVLGVADADPNEGRGTAQLLVEAVTEGHPAARAGLKPGDRIIGVDEFTEAQLGPDLLSRLLSPSFNVAGTRHKLTIERGAQTLEVSITSQEQERDDSP